MHTAASKIGSSHVIRYRGWRKTERTAGDKADDTAAKLERFLIYMDYAPFGSLDMVNKFAKEMYEEPKSALRLTEVTQRLSLSSGAASRLLHRYA